MGKERKNSTASSTVICSTSAMFLPLNRTDRVSSLKRWPPHPSQFTNTSGRKLISFLILPWPEHSSHRPPLTLKENRLGVYPRIRASGCSA